MWGATFSWSRLIIIILSLNGRVCSEGVIAAIKDSVQSLSRPIVILYSHTVAGQ